MSWDPASGRIYFETRNGFHWEVWFSYRDGRPDLNGSAEWKASSLKHWRRISAMREADALWHAYQAGLREMFPEPREAET